MTASSVQAREVRAISRLQSNSIFTETPRSILGFWRFSQKSERRNAGGGDGAYRAEPYQATFTRAALSGRSEPKARW